MTHRFTCIALGLMLAAGADLACTHARAQTHAPAPAPSAASVALAKEVISLKGGSSMFEAVVPGVIESAKNMFLPTNPNLNKELNEVTAQLRKEFEPKKAELMTEVARAYAQRFSEQELKEMLAFYRTALGKKMLSDEPLAVEAGLKRAQDWANDFSGVVIDKMRAEMKNRGHDL